MYVGAWQEYKLMKIIENLRKENEGFRRGFYESGVGVGCPTSSLPHGGENVNNYQNLSSERGKGLADSFVLTSAGTHSSSQHPALRNLRGDNLIGVKPTLRRTKTIQGVDVFVEEWEIPEMAHTKNMADAGNHRLSGPSKNHICTNDTKPQLLSSNCSVTTSVASTAAHAHVEMGTGKVVKIPPAQTTPCTRMNSEMCLLQALIEQPKVLADPFLSDLLRKTSLGTKSKYQHTCEPLSKRQLAKKLKDNNGGNDKKIQKQIERRLRLQMLYSGNTVAPDTTTPSVLQDTPGIQWQQQGMLQPPQKQQEEQNMMVDSTLPSCWSVPWDTPSNNIYNTLNVADLAATAKSSPVPPPSASKLRGVRSPGQLSSTQHSRRLMHPYDVGAPLAPPVLNGSCLNNSATASLCVSKAPERGYGDYVKNDSYPGREGACPPTYGAYHEPSDINSTQPKAHVNPKSPLAFFSEPLVENSALSASNFTRGAAQWSHLVEPLDDDSVGALLSWAQELDPNSIV